MPQNQTKSSALDIMKQLQDLGLVNNFKFEPDGIVCVETGKTYSADELAIQASYRFEGESDPDDSSILYVLRAHDGTGGTLMDAYGAFATPGLGEFICKVADNRRRSDLMNLVPARKTITVHLGELDERHMTVAQSG